LSPGPEIEPVLKALNDHDAFYILGHEDPDADCAGAQRVLGSWLARRGKIVHLCSAGAWNRPEISDWAKYFSLGIPPLENGAKPLNVILDCSTPDRTGYRPEELPAAPFCVIDHHAAGSDFGDYRYIDPSSPSTTLLIQNLMESAGSDITAEEAEILFLGFCTDTGYFRHVEPGRSEPLESVARLVAAGASPSETFRLLAGGRSIGSRRLLGRVLERAALHFGGRLVVTWETWKDWKELGSERDSDMLYQLMLSIAGVEAAMVVREQDDGRCVVGLRSVNSLDVGEIAGLFGGGGHRKAAGCTLTGSLADITGRFLDVFAGRLGPS
jgi:phosphoesterase RecJ-like protein